MSDDIDTTVAMEALTRDVLNVVQTIGPASHRQIEMIANVIASAYLRGVNDGNAIAMQAMEESLGVSTSKQVH